MWSSLSKLILKLLGWKAEHTPFPEPRGILVVYPHTSNWDFPLGLLWQSACKVSPRWVAKDSIFKPAPIGWIMRKLGGIGIKREGNLDVAQSLKKVMLEQEHCWLVLAIEGTRSYKPFVHLGYYFIAKAANVPIGLAHFDYSTKTVSVHHYRRVMDTPEAEIEQLKIDFARTHAYAPEKASALALKQKRGSTE